MDGRVGVLRTADEGAVRLAPRSWLPTCGRAAGAGRDTDGLDAGRLAACADAGADRAWELL